MLFTIEIDCFSNSSTQKQKKSLKAVLWDVVVEQRDPIETNVFFHLEVVLNYSNNTANLFIQLSQRHTQKAKAKLNPGTQGQIYASGLLCHLPSNPACAQKVTDLWKVNTPEERKTWWTWWA